MPEWSAEIAVDERLVRRLIEDQFPQVELGSLRLLGEGWDNSVWLVDERWIFRFPRRQVAVAGVERQMALLPRLAPVLPVPIPAPVYAGLPADGYPWPFFGTPFLRRHEAADAELDDAARIRLVPRLAEFLRALHAVDIVAPDELPIDPLGRTDMALLVPRTLERLDDVDRMGIWRRPPKINRLLETALELPPPTDTVVAHGDLHFRHLVVDDDGALAGVVDWDDVCRADRSIDLQLYWSFLPPDVRGDFLDAYGTVSEEQLRRARVLALFLSTALAAYGRHEGMVNVEREAVAGLRLTARD